MGIQSTVGRENSVYEGLKAETNRKVSSVAKWWPVAGEAGRGWVTLDPVAERILVDTQRLRHIDGLWLVSVLKGGRSCTLVNDCNSSPRCSIRSIIS